MRLRHPSGDQRPQAKEPRSAPEPQRHVVGRSIWIEPGEALRLAVSRA